MTLGWEQQEWGEGHCATRTSDDHEEQENIEIFKPEKNNHSNLSVGPK